MSSASAATVRGDVKSRILRTATRLFAKQGFSGTSLQAIVEEVGIRKPSLLYHFPSKEALREAVLAQLVASWQVRVPGILAAATSRADQLDAILGEVSDFFAEDPSRARLIWREAIDRPRRTREHMSQDFGPWLQMLTDAIRRGQESGRVRAEVDPEAWITQLIVLVIGTFAAADLAAAAFPDTGENRVDRQVAELIRTARFSLYSSSPATRSEELLTPKSQEE
jgi:AcrR family transcriptional regulator